MPPIRVRWHRLLGVYVALAAVCLVVSFCLNPPVHGILPAIGVLLVAGFVPLITAIYFLRGFLGIH